MILIRPVILCGGSGTRLWPLSRAGFPKQFLCLTGKESLFQQAVSRMTTLKNTQISLATPSIVTNEEHRFLALEQLREARIEAEILLEPVARNTAPALTLAAFSAIENGDDPVLVVTPADQTIADTASFTRTVQKAIHQAALGNIVILGIAPNKPETGYGYIKVTDNQNADDALLVERFVEKPDAATAQRYIDEGGYFWNAGIFVLKASVWLKALNAFRPDILLATEAAWLLRSMDNKFLRPDPQKFSAILGESIDYAVMERAGTLFPITMLPLNAGWSDLGTWGSMWDALPKDNDGNVHRGDVLSVDSRNTLVQANSRLVSLIGVKNIVVIETPDAVLVADKSCSQEVKQLVNTLDQQQRTEQILHRKVHRPWGWYDSIDEDDRFKVKRILVKPKASLSLQKHHHRAEHWVVVKGTAEITCGDKTLLLGENQSTYIPLGEVHRLSNPGTISLEIIEIQSGSYLGEDDIVRFEDNYGRKS